MRKTKNFIERIKSRQEGFTLVEVMVALLVFSVGLLAVATMQISSVGGNETARRVMDASTLAANQLETFMSFQYADLTPGAQAPFNVGDYTMSWTITDDSPAQNTKTVSVTVQDDKQNKTVTLTSVVPQII